MFINGSIFLQKMSKLSQATATFINNYVVCFFLTNMVRGTTLVLNFTIQTPQTKKVHLCRLSMEQCDFFVVLVESRQDISCQNCLWIIVSDRRTHTHVFQLTLVTDRRKLFEVLGGRIIFKTQIFCHPRQGNLGSAAKAFLTRSSY